MNYILTEAPPPFWLPKNTPLPPKGKHAPVSDDGNLMPSPPDNDQFWIDIRDDLSCHLVWDALNDIKSLRPTNL